MAANFKKLLSRKHAVLTDSIILSAWNDKALFERMTGFPDYVRNLEIIDGDFYFDEGWMNNITKKYSNLSEDSFLDFIRKGYKAGEDVKKFAKSLDLKKIPIKDLEVAFDKSVELLRELLVFLPITHPLAKSVEEKLIKIVELRGAAKEKIDMVMLEILTPDKLNTPALELVSLKRIKDSISNPSFDLNAALVKHAQEYGFLGYREPFSKGYSLESFRERLHGLVEKPSQKTQSKYDFNEKESAVVNLMKEFVYFRNYRTEKLYESLYYLEPLWIELSKKHLLHKDTDFAYYTLSEIRRLLKDGTKIADDILSDRMVAHAFLLHDDKLELITGGELARKKSLLNKYDKTIKEIKGSIACKGTVVGTAKIVLKASDQFKVKEGDILVTSMTTPDFIPCMKKALAFVTDEGGITCHAAIVAREMNKPCIIGTKSATQIIRDGDMVEVDAERGVVKIIS